MKTIKLLILLLSFAAGLASLTSCKDDEPTPIAEAPIFVMDENFEITATCANAYKAYVNGIETILPLTITQSNYQQTIVVSGYGYGINLQNSDTVEQTFVVPALEEYVDLGLPSGTLWATRNVGASSPEEYGDYFAWGETEPKDYYDWDTYKWCNGDEETLTKYCTDGSLGYNGFVDNKTELDPSDDAACAHYPDGRMPSMEQIQELCAYGTWQWTRRNGVSGSLVTGPNGNSLFLPAAGDRWRDFFYYYSPCGYWSRTLLSDYSGSAIHLDFDSSNSSNWSYSYRSTGRTVRAVRVVQN